MITSRENCIETNPFGSIVVIAFSFHWLQPAEILSTTGLAGCRRKSFRRHQCRERNPRIFPDVLCRRRHQFSAASDQNQGSLPETPRPGHASTVRIELAANLRRRVARGRPRLYDAPLYFQRPLPGKGTDPLRILLFYFEARAQSLMRASRLLLQRYSPP